MAFVFVSERDLLDMTIYESIEEAKQANPEWLLEESDRDIRCWSVSKDTGRAYPWNRDCIGVLVSARKGR